MKKSIHLVVACAAACLMMTITPAAAATEPIDDQISALYGNDTLVGADLGMPDDAAAFGNDNDRAMPISGIYYFNTAIADGALPVTVLDDQGGHAFGAPILDSLDGRAAVDFAGHFASG